MRPVKKNQVSIDNIDPEQLESEEEQQEDYLIVFLDAASDSDEDALQKVIDSNGSDEKIKRMVTFQDGDRNTALHFGAKNGNFKICQVIIDEATRLQMIDVLINCRNNFGFTPLIEVAMRGYQFIGDKDKSLENRWRIVKKLLSAGANPNYCKPETKMTALHWLAHNDDGAAIQILLDNNANHLALSHDNNLPIDVAGTTPSYQSLDVLLENFQQLNNIQQLKGLHGGKMMHVDNMMSQANNETHVENNTYLEKGERDLAGIGLINTNEAKIDFANNSGEQILDGDQNNLPNVFESSRKSLASRQSSNRMAQEMDRNLKLAGDFEQINKDFGEGKLNTSNRSRVADEEPPNKKSNVIDSYRRIASVYRTSQGSEESERSAHEGNVALNSKLSRSKRDKIGSVESRIQENKTVIIEEQFESIPYQSAVSMDIAIGADLELEEDNLEEAKIMIRDSIKINVVDKRHFKNDENAMIAYRYLYWACMRGHIFIVDYILKKYGISPFMAEKAEGKSPFLIAIEHNQEKVVRLLLLKEFLYKADEKLINRQKRQADKYGNSPLHKACRFRNKYLIKILLDSGIADVTQRNYMAKLPLEMPHNDILNDLEIKQVFAEYLEQRPELKDTIRLNKEPDYMFVVNLKRKEVLIEQLQAINLRYEFKKRDRADTFGLLHGNRKFLDWKEYRHSSDPEGKGLILVHFSDRILNLKAEEIGMKVILQNKFQALPFVLEAQNNFQRFSSSQKISLFRKIFEEEFDIQVLSQAEVIKDHFMLHSHQKDAILNSWAQHRLPLIWSMIGMGDLRKHIQPILLIGDYYGEKQALYFTFLIHHIAMLLIPAFFGIVLWGYHLYLGSQYEPADDEATNFISNYLAILDTRWNYPYLVMLAIWSTIYIESWKRKQNTVKYIWASEQRKDEIQKAQKRDQKGANYFVEKVSGKKTLSVLIETPLRNGLRSIGLILLAMCVAYGIWYLCMRQLNEWALQADALNNKDYILPNLWSRIFIYSVAVIYFNRYFGSAARKIVTAENRKYKKEHEESLIQKSFTLGFFNSYVGMTWAAFYDQKLSGVCLLLLTVLVLKQLILNLIDLFRPKCKQPKRFNAHKQQILDHYTKYPEDYGEEGGNDSIQNKFEHYEAEKQTLMANMPPHLVPQYNVVVIQLGWILFFSITFPAAGLFTIFSGIISMSILLTGMSQYKKKNEPEPILDIGIYMDLLEFMSSLGILVCMYIIIFTSKQLTDGMPYDDHVMYILGFTALHIIFIIKYVLAEIIDDVPAWVTEDEELQENRVDQIEKDNQDKKLWERMSDHYTDIDLLFEVLGMQHGDLAKSAQLVPKLKEGCEQWLRANELPEGQSTQKLFEKKQRDDRQSESENHVKTEFRHVSRSIQRKKLQQVYLGL